jgi:hypothetical protein
MCKRSILDLEVTNPQVQVWATSHNKGRKGPKDVQVQIRIFCYMGAMHHINPKIHGNFKYWKKSESSWKYSYKNIWSRNDSHGIVGEKDKFMIKLAWLVHRHGAFRHSRIFFIQVKYLIIFGSSKHSDLLTLFYLLFFFWMYWVPSTHEAMITMSQHIS